MRILVIRRDNIGDLVCTTPLLHRLRQHWPQAGIDVLVNRYNAEVLTGNPDIDAVFAYQKAKHRPTGVSRMAVWGQTARLLWHLRQRRYDLALIASPGGERFAHWAGAKRILGQKGETGHEVERCAALLAPLGITGEPGPLVLRANPAGEKRAMGRVVGLHLSARKPLQRWPADFYVALARALLAGGHADCIHLFWAPGASDDPLHPGDDEKARAVCDALAGLPVVPVATESLRELIDGIAACKRFICSDGGAMHLAAGLGKPIVCFFGNSGPERWRPWGVPHQLLQAASQCVADIPVAAALAAYERLAAQT